MTMKLLLPSLLLVLVAQALLATLKTGLTRHEYTLAKLVSFTHIASFTRASRVVRIVWSICVKVEAC